MKLFKKDFAFYRKVLILALPIAGQSLITVFVNMLDTIMLGKVGNFYTTVKEDAQVISSNSIAAAGNSNSFISIYHILCMGLGMGASVLVSRYWGMKQKANRDGNEEEEKKAEKSMKKTIALMLRFTLGLALIFACVAFFFPEKIHASYLDARNENRAQIIEYGVSYLKCSVPTFFFLGVSLVSTIVLRSVGSALYPLFVSIGALVVNLVGNYMLIFGHFGAPRLGIEGAAIATLIARIFECVCILIYLLIIDKKIRFRIKHVFMSCSSMLWEYVRVCIPVLLSDGLLAFGNNFFAQIIGKLGYTTANNITQVTQQLSTVGIQGVCQAGAIVTGQTLGTGDKERTKEQAWLFLGLGLVLGAISAAIILCFNRLIISGYDVTPTDREIAATLMQAISLIIVFQATNSIMTKGVLRGGGDTLMLMIMDNIFLWAVALPLGWVAGFKLHWSPFMVYICLKSDQIFKMIWCVFRLKGGKWIKKIQVK